MVPLTSREGVEGGAGTQVDQTEQGTYDSREDERPEGDFVSMVNAAPDTRSGDSTIPAECPRAAGRRRQRPDRRECPDTQNYPDQPRPAARLRRPSLRKSRPMAAGVLPVTV